MKRSIWIAMAVLALAGGAPTQSRAAEEVLPPNRVTVVEPGQVKPDDKPQQLRRFTGKIVAVRDEKLDGRDMVMRVRTDQGEIPVAAGATWAEQKGHINLHNGDDVAITGYLAGFGAQRHIVAQQITANGKTVHFDVAGRPYRETSKDLNEPSTMPNDNAQPSEQEPGATKPGTLPGNQRDESQRP